MTRNQLLSILAGRITELHLKRPVLIAFDGIDGAGKTTLADELVSWCERRGRPVLRASVDRFHRPRAERYARGPLSPLGYYEDSFDYPFLIERFLKPLREFQGAVSAVTAKFDFRTDTESLLTKSDIVRNTVVLFDGVFLFRPELVNYWDLKVFLAIDFETSWRRGLERDASWMETEEVARAKYDTRYVPGQKIYFTKVNPKSVADIFIDNNDPQTPRLLSIERPDQGQIERGSSDKFWNLITKRRKQETLGRAALERMIQSGK